MRRILTVIFSLQYLFVLVNTGYTQCFYPANTDNIIHHDYFSLNYNEDMEQADWVCHMLTSSMINGNAVRKNNS